MGLDKIVSLDAMLARKQEAEARGLKLVMTFGAYQSLHIGHIRHLRQARSLGDLLVVVLAPNDASRAAEPEVPEEMRAEALAHLDFVDYICTGSEGLRPSLALLKPAVYVARSECGNGLADEAKSLCDALGVRYACTDPVNFDSTLGINRFLAGFSQEVREYLDMFRARFSLRDVENLLDAMASLKVAVVGDTIIDEYCYCNILGASSKDPILALRYRDNDLFAGGIVAVANHVANFAAEVGLYTVIGEYDTYEDFIVSRMGPKISPRFAVQNKAPTVRKRRYVEGYSQNKLFEIYFIEDSGLAPEKDAAFCDQLARELPGYDVVVVADFGHGAISPAARQVLMRHAPFLAVNVQANSGNRGFNTITKYSRADYISIAEHELRLEMRDVRGPVQPMIDHLAASLTCGNFVVTRGKRGSIIRNANGHFVEVPAFAQKVVDRVGAGDAFLSITALAAVLHTPPELLCFVGNVVGALAVEILGNQKASDKDSVKKFAAMLLG